MNNKKEDIISNISPSTPHRAYTPLTLSQLGGLHLLLTTLITHGGISETDIIASTRQRYPTVRTYFKSKYSPNNGILATKRRAVAARVRIM